MNLRLLLILITAMGIIYLSCGKEKTTAPIVNNPPAVPVYLAPAHQASIIDTVVQFAWHCSDPDNDPLTYDVYLSTSASPALYRANWNADTLRATGLLRDSLYYWKIVAKDDHSHETSGSTYYFAIQPLIEQVAWYNFPNYSHFNDFTFINGYAVFSGRPGGGYGLSVVDVSNPDSIQIPATYFEDYTTPNSILSFGNYAYVSGSGGLAIIDISNILAPQFTGICPNHWDSEGRFDVFGNYAFLALENDGLWVINVSNPHSPYDVGHYYRAKAWSVVTDGEYAFMTDSLGLAIINVSNPALPSLAGQYSLPMRSNQSYIAPLVLTGEYIYVGTENDMRIVNISDRANPQLAGTIPIARVDDIFIDGNRAYLSRTTGGTWILDVSNQAAPELLASSQIGGEVIRFSSGYIYVLAGTSSIWIMRPNF